MYLTYDEYLNMGGTLESTAFNLKGYDAEKLIDRRTFNRIKKDKDFVIPMDLKICMFKLIDILQEREQFIKGIDSQQVVASRSNDGVSVSYVTYNIEDKKKEFESKLKSSIEECLYGITTSKGIPLLNRGLQ